MHSKTWDSYFNQYLVTAALLLILIFSVVVDSKYRGIDTNMNGKLNVLSCRAQCDGDYNICRLASLTYRRRFQCVLERQECNKNCARRFDSRAFHLRK